MSQAALIIRSRVPKYVIKPTSRNFETRFRSGICNKKFESIAVAHLLHVFTGLMGFMGCLKNLGENRIFLNHRHTSVSLHPI